MHRVWRRSRARCCLFKKKFFDLLEKAYTQGYEAGEIELFADAQEIMRFRILIEEGGWKNELEGALTN